MSNLTNSVPLSFSFRNLIKHRLSLTCKRKILRNTIFFHNLYVTLFSITLISKFQHHCDANFNESSNVSPSFKRFKLFFQLNKWTFYAFILSIKSVLFIDYVNPVFATFLKYLIMFLNHNLLMAYPNFSILRKPYIVSSNSIHLQMLYILYHILIIN